MEKTRDVATETVSNDMWKNFKGKAFVSNENVRESSTWVTGTVEMERGRKISVE